MKFEVISAIENIETIAVGHGIRDLAILTKRFGAGNWRKAQGLCDGTLLEWHDG